MRKYKERSYFKGGGLGLERGGQQYRHSPSPTNTTAARGPGQGLWRQLMEKLPGPVPIWGSSRGFVLTSPSFWDDCQFTLPPLPHGVILGKSLYFQRFKQHNSNKKSEWPTGQKPVEASGLCLSSGPCSAPVWGHTRACHDLAKLILTTSLPTCLNKKLWFTPEIWIRWPAAWSFLRGSWAGEGRPTFLSY